MGSVFKRWKSRITRRFKFTASYSELLVESCDSAWQPSNLSLVWDRKARREVTDCLYWEPTQENQWKCVWPSGPPMKEILVTLYRHQKKEEYDDKVEETMMWRTTTRMTTTTRISQLGD